MSKSKTTWAALAVTSLLFNAMEVVASPATSNARAVFVEHISCDNGYGKALEAVMYEGNLREMWALLSSHEHTIDEVIAVTIHGNGAGGECSQQNVWYTNDRLEGESMDALRSQRQSGMRVYTVELLL